MLNNLKKTQKNPIFVDDEDDMDIDNMDFPLPNEGPSSSGPNLGGMPGMGGMGGMPDMAQIQQMMQNMGGAGGLGDMGGLGGMMGGDAQRPGAAPARDPGFVTVASGPNGNIRQMNPEQYKE